MSPQEIAAFFDQRFLGNSTRAWVVAAVVATSIWIILPLLKRRCSKLRRRADHVPAGLDLILRLVDGTTQIFMWIVALYAAERLLELPEQVERASTIVVLIVAWMQIGRWASIAFDHLMARQRARRGAADVAFAGSIAVIRFIALVVIWSLVLLLALDNLGVDVTALIAGLGIGGVAAALAIQSLLKSLLGSLAITLDRPFVVGDNITVGQVSGKVEHIGVRSTHLRAASGELIVMSNAELVQARIRNFGRMEERRGVMVFNIAYETPAAGVRRVSAIVAEVVDALPGVRFDRCHFRSFGVEGLTFEAVFFVTDSQIDALLSVQQVINLALTEALRREGISFAYPVQRIQPELVPAIS